MTNEVLADWWEEDLPVWLKGRTLCTADQIFGGLGLNPQACGRTEVYALSRAMKRLGWVTSVANIEGARRRVWVPGSSRTSVRTPKFFNLTDRAVEELLQLAKKWDCSQSAVVNRLLIDCAEASNDYQLRDYQQATVDMVAERLKGA
jgi:hypothetical protein